MAIKNLNQILKESEEEELRKIAAKEASSDFHFKVGSDFLKAREYAKAALEFRKAVLSVHPNAKGRLLHSVAKEYHEAGLLIDAVIVLGEKFESYEEFNVPLDMSGVCDETIIEHALEIDPNNWGMWLYAGMVYDALEGDEGKAVSALKKCCKLKPQSWMGFMYLGQVYHRNKRFQKALETFEKAGEMAYEERKLLTGDSDDELPDLDINKRYIIYNLDRKKKILLDNLKEAYLTSGQSDKGIGFFRKIGEEAFAAELSKAKKSKGVKADEKQEAPVSSLHKEKSIDDYVNEEDFFRAGELSFYRRDYDKAIKYLQTATWAREKPEEAGKKAFLLLGKALEAKGKTEEAVQDFEKAVELGSEEAKIYLQKISDRKFSDKLSLFDVRMPLIDDSFEILLGKGQECYERSFEFDEEHTLNKVGSLDKAIGYFSKAIGLIPENAEAHFRLSIAYINRNELFLGYRKDQEQGMKHLEKAVQLDLHNPKYNLWHHYMLALTASSLDDKIGELKKALEFNPEDYNIRYHLAAAYERKGKLEQAQKEIEAALEIKPGNSAYESWHHLILGERTDNVDDKKREFEQVVKLSPGDAYILSRIASDYEKSGMLEKALDTAKQCWAKDPYNMDYDFLISRIKRKLEENDKKPE